MKMKLYYVGNTENVSERVIKTESIASTRTQVHIEADTYTFPDIKLPYSLIQMQHIWCTILPNYIPWVCFDFFLVYFSLLPRTSKRCAQAPADQNVMLWPSASPANPPFPPTCKGGGKRWRWRRVSLAASRCLGNEVLAIFVGEGVNSIIKTFASLAKVWYLV